MSLVDAPIMVPVTITNIAALSTVITKVADFAPVSGYGVRRIRITNDHASNMLAYYVTALTSTTPTFVASASGTVATTEGVKVYPKSHEYIQVGSACSLWVVASAASTPVQICEFDQARV